MKKMVCVILAVLLFLIMGFSLYKILNPEPEGYKRQAVEEDLADQFLEMVRNQDKELNENKAGIISFCEEDGSLDETRPDFSDDNYYSRDGITYTPDYAKGYLQCVLEIPKDSVKIKRGVYAGTRDEIAYDLSIWMVTAARPDYELGKTHFVIYGHNHTEQNLSFNRLKNVEVGDVFYLTDTKAEYTYEVTKILKMTRGEVARNLVDNFELSSDLCYIVTCGRNEMRYYDLVVEGKVKSVKSFKK